LVLAAPLEPLLLMASAVALAHLGLVHPLQQLVAAAAEEVPAVLERAHLADLEVDPDKVLLAVLELWGREIVVGLGFGLVRLATIMAAAVEERPQLAKTVTTTMEKFQTAALEAMNGVRLHKQLARVYLAILLAAAAEELLQILQLQTHHLEAAVSAEEVLEAELGLFQQLALKILEAAAVAVLPGILFKVEQLVDLE
jgi:hypothetical protein